MKLIKPSKRAEDYKPYLATGALKFLRALANPPKRVALLETIVGLLTG